MEKHLARNLGIVINMDLPVQMEAQKNVILVPTIDLILPS